MKVKYCVYYDTETKILKIDDREIGRYNPQNAAKEAGGELQRQIRKNEVENIIRAAVNATL